jgi:tRNA(Ser,Leu) C12 N-acetylase TAN1
MKNINLKRENLSPINKQGGLEITKNLNPPLDNYIAVKIYTQEGYISYLLPCQENKPFHQWHSMKEIVKRWKKLHSWWKENL